MDFLEHPVELKRLSRAILDHHVKVVREFAACGVDGIFTSDDLGSQRALMMSPTVFRRFLKAALRGADRRVPCAGVALLAPRMRQHPGDPR